MIWFVEDPARSRSERRSIEELVGSVDWLEPIGWRVDEAPRLIWDADIRIESKLYPVSLRFSNNFPYSPAIVLPRGEQTRWSSHQYGAAGELCLQYGPDNWHDELTGADMIQSAYRLLLGEAQGAQGGPPVPSRDQTTIGAVVRGSFSKYFFGLEAQAYLASLQEGTVSLGFELNLFQGKGLTKFLLEGSSPEWKNSTLPKALFQFGYRLPVALIRLPAASPLSIPTMTSALLDELKSRSLDIANAEVIVFVHDDVVSAVELDRKNNGLENIAIINERYSAERLPQSHEVLLQKKVAIVGCGSLGSKVATTLARSGVRSFVLVDEDILLPENLVRNDLDWRDIGAHKVDSVAAKMKLVRPDANCSRYRRRLGGQGSSGAIEGLLDVLADCDLIIDATAEPSAFNILSSISKFSQKAAIVWGEIFAGGIGGMMARYRRSLEPSPQTMRLRIDSWCADQGAPVPQTAAPYAMGGDIPEIADDADVSIIAGHVSAFAIDTLLSRQPSNYSFSAYLIGLRPEWVFSQALEVKAIDVGAPDQTQKAATDPAELEAEILKIMELLTQHKDADSSGK